MHKLTKRMLSAALCGVLATGSLIPGVGAQQAEAAGNNLALNKPVEVSSLDPASQGGQNGENAVDGDLETRWTSNRAAGYDLHEWITVDLESTYMIDSVEIDWEAAYGSEYTVQVSTDGEKYETAATITDGKKEENRVIDIEPVAARYVKLDLTKKGSDKYGYSIWELRVFGESANVVQNDGVSVTASGTENNSTVLTAEKAIDGQTGFNETRWSGAKEDEQWLLVDLGKAYTLEQVNVDFFREAADYTVEISENGETYTEILNVKDNPTINVENVRGIVFEEQPVRYIKFHQSKMFTSDSNGQKYSASIYEVEAYQKAEGQQEPEKPQSAKEVLAYIEKNGFAVPEKSGEKIIFDEEITKGYDVEIYGSDYKPIIAMDGTYHQPLTGKNVHLMYQVTNQNNAEDKAVSTKDQTVFVAGKYEEPGVNAAPQVIPSLQEWYGAEGKYQFTDTSAVVYSDSAMAVQAQLVAEYLSNLLNRDVASRVGSPKTGDIYLDLSTEEETASLGKEGYLLNVGDYVEVKSSTVNGAFYGGVSVVQMLYLQSETLTIDKGTARDYPKYEVRSIALDIARSEIQIDYIREITEVLPFFKINEVVMHINDDRGDKISNTDIGSEENQKQARDLSSFRIENEKGIGDHAYQISKEDYIQYQKDAAEYGVTVVTELDTPAHSAVFSLLDEMKDNMYDVRHLEILEDKKVSNVKDVELNKKTMAFVDTLTEELIGEHPGDAVIQTPVFHFGTDEYKTSAVYSEAMQQYINHYVDFIQDRGYEARAWASTDGSSGFKGYITPQNKEVTYYLWAPYWADVKKTVANGNPIINCSGSSLYIVPGGNNGYQNYLNISRLYNNWSVNDITTTRGSGGAVIPISHPQLRGASVVLWNDDGFLLDGISDFDLYDRLKESFPVIAERTWYGEKTDGQSFEEFQAVSAHLLKKGPTSNPARYVESAGEEIVKYNFEEVKDSVIEDQSENGYDATGNNLALTKGKEGKALSLNGENYLSLPFDTVGFPASVSFDLYVDKNTDKDAVLFDGKDGTIHLNQKNKVGEYTNLLGYERDGYTYTFNYTIPEKKWVNILITADRNGTKLYVNNRYKANGKRTEFGEYVKKDLSTSMILPTEKIGEGIVGKLDNLTIYNSALDIPGPENIAPTAVKWTASNAFNDDFTGAKAIDKNMKTRWATTNEVTSAWLELDFGKEVKINETRITEYKAANNHIDKYSIEYWNGEIWVEGFTHTVKAADKTSVPGVASGASFGGEFETITTSKIRLNITEASRPSIYEFELYYVPEEEPEVPEEREYTITAIAGEGGSITPSGEVVVKEGEEQTFAIATEEGYEIEDVVVNGESKGALTEYTFTNVEADGTISVTFKKTETKPPVDPENPDPDNPNPDNPDLDKPDTDKPNTGKPDASDKPSTEKPPKAEGAVQTGDETSVCMMLVLLGVSAIEILVVIRGKSSVTND